MSLGFQQGNFELLYFGLGLPLWIYFLIVYLKLINRIKAEEEFVQIRNLVFGGTVVNYKDILQWEEIDTYRISQRNILLKLKGKKIIVSNLIDLKNYEILRHRLKTHWSKSERKYN
jgi:hypothetical protein